MMDEKTNNQLTPSFFFMMKNLALNGYFVMGFTEYYGLDY